MIRLEKYLNIPGNLPSCQEKAWDSLRMEKQEGTVVVISCQSIGRFPVCEKCLYRGQSVKIDLQAVRSMAFPSERHDFDNRSEFDGTQSVNEY